MTQKNRALVLTIDANSDQDRRALLRQALYEIDKLLPPADDAEVSVKNSYVMRGFSAAGNERVTKGNTSGSIGHYQFEFFNSSRLFHSLENTLLSDGYLKSAHTYLFVSDPIYVHPSLPPKSIAGNPSEICDAPVDAMGKPL